jgi:hypothetical protein
MVRKDDEEKVKIAGNEHENVIVNVRKEGERLGMVKLRKG